MSTTHTGASQEDTIAASDGLRLFARRWPAPGAARAVVLITHGYAEHSGRYEHVAAHLAAHGYVTHSYDLRGHGRSEGRRAFVESFDVYLDDLGAMHRHIRAAHPEAPLFLFGHSMGGAIVTLYALERQPETAGLILSSPALRVSDEPPALLGRLAPLLARLFPHLPTLKLDRRHLSRDPAVVAQAEADPLNYHGRLPARTGAELLRATARIDQQMQHLALPILLFHGTADRLTDPEGSLALYRRARSTDKTLALYPGFYHETLNEPEKHEVLTNLTDWLDEHADEG